MQSYTKFDYKNHARYSESTEPTFPRPCYWSRSCLELGILIGLVSHFNSGRTCKPEHLSLCDVLGAILMRLLAYDHCNLMIWIEFSSFLLINNHDCHHNQRRLNHYLCHRNATMRLFWLSTLFSARRKGSPSLLLLNYRPVSYFLQYSLFLAPSISCDMFMVRQWWVEINWAIIIWITWCVFVVTCTLR